MRGAIRIFFLICGIFSALPVYAVDVTAARELLDSIDISNHENVALEIYDAYQALDAVVTEAENLNQEYINDLQENADAMHETEQSLENRMLGGAAMVTTGIGAMQLGAAMAEQSADAAAQRDMSAYLATFRCDYGAGANIQGGETNITLPGANTLLTLRTEYMDLAADIKIRKESLGLPPGIESETILDATQYNLYNNESIGITDGAYASVSRALTNTGGDDATEWAAMKSETAEQLKSGAIAAGIGAVGSAVANRVINKDAPQERSREITNEYNNKLQTIESEIDEKQNALLTAIDENEQRIAEYNELLNQHNEFIATITPECQDGFSEYITVVNSAEPITDNLIDVKTLPLYEYDLDDLETALAVCTDGADALTNMSYMSTGTNSKPICTQFIINIENGGNSRLSEDQRCLVKCMLEASNRNCEVAEANMDENGQCICNPGGATGYDTVPLMYRVCDGEIPDGANGICEEEFFRDKRLQPTNAVALAKEWALLKHNDNITCDETSRRCNNKFLASSDCLQCKSVDNNTYYEFVFRKIDAVGDNNIEHSIKESICALHETEFVKSGIVPPRTNGVGIVIDPGYSWPDYCATDSSEICNKVAKTSEQFGYATNVLDVKEAEKGCVFSAVTRDIIEQQGQAAGIDPYVLYSAQIYLNGDIEAQICKYVENEIKPTELESCQCNAGSTPIREEGGVWGTTDDVLTCYINGEPVSFVFDDLSESKNYNIESGMQQLSCVVEGGTFDGTKCRGLDEKACLSLKASNMEICPECAAVDWDPVTEQCKLPAAAKATNIKQGIKIATAVGSIAVGAVLATVTGAGGVLIIVEVVFGAGAEIARNYQYLDGYEFLDESEKCKDSSCAATLISENLKRLADHADNFNHDQFNAIDAELARLIDLLPEETVEQLSREFQNGIQLEGNDPNIWNQSTSEWLELLGNVVSGVSAFGGLFKSGIKFAFNKTTRALTKRISKRVTGNVDNVLSPITPSEAKRLEQLNAQQTRLVARQQANPGASEAADIRRELTTVNQERQRILNKVGNSSDDTLAATKTANPQPSNTEGKRLVDDTLDLDLEDEAAIAARRASRNSSPATDLFADGRGLAAYKPIGSRTLRQGNFNKNLVNLFTSGHDKLYVNIGDFDLTDRAKFKLLLKLTDQKQLARYDFSRSSIITIGGKSNINTNKVINILDKIDQVNASYDVIDILAEQDYSIDEIDTILENVAKAGGMSYLYLVTGGGLSMGTAVKTLVDIY